MLLNFSNTRFGIFIEILLIYHWEEIYYFTPRPNFKLIFENLVLLKKNIRILIPVHFSSVPAPFRHLICTNFLHWGRKRNNSNNSKQQYYQSIKKASYLMPNTLKIKCRFNAHFIWDISIFAANKNSIL